MHVCFVSTYHQPCGIATYTEKLAKTIAKEHQVTVLGELGERLMPKQYRDDQVAVAQVWHRQFNGGKNSISNIGKLIASMNVKPAVVHVQHEFGLFSNNDVFFDMLAQLIVQNVTPFVTLHTVTFERAAFYRKLIDMKVGLVVHTSEAAAAAARTSDSYVPYIIPHGVDVHVGERRGQYFLVPGFVSESKNTLEIMSAYLEAREAGVTTPLRIVGLCRSENYETRIRSKIAEYSADDYITLENGFVSDERFVELYEGAVACILGNDRRSPFSSSGQMAIAMGMGVPTIAKNVAIYRGVDGVLYYDDAVHCALWMKALAKNDTLRSKLGRTLHSQALTRTWDTVARTHVEAYQDVRETNLLTRSTVKQN